MGTVTATRSPFGLRQNKMTIQLNNRSGGPAHACEAMRTEHARARAWPHQRPPARGRQPRRPPGGKKNPASMHASEWGVEPPTLAHRARRFPLQAADQGQKLRRPDNREHHLVSTLAIRSGTREQTDKNERWARPRKKASAKSRISSAKAGSAARLDEFPRPGWQVSASDRCEKHPIVTFEPGRDLGARPGAEPARRAHAQQFFSRRLHAAHASDGEEEEVGEVSVRRQMMSPRPQWPREPRPLP